MKIGQKVNLRVPHCQMTCQMETDENDKICSEGHFYDLNNRLLLRKMARFVKNDAFIIKTTIYF